MKTIIFMLALIATNFAFANGTNGTNETKIRSLILNEYKVVNTATNEVIILNPQTVDL